jgi:hypothetical protein
MSGGRRAAKHGIRRRVAPLRNFPSFARNTKEHADEKEQEHAPGDIKDFHVLLLNPHLSRESGISKERRGIRRRFFAAFLL